ncbi:MAG: hypothetical protein ACI4V1_00070, partial [Eubacteriales bacterium]
ERNLAKVEVAGPSPVIRLWKMAMYKSTSLFLAAARFLPKLQGSFSQKLQDRVRSRMDSKKPAWMFHAGFAFE